MILFPIFKVFSAALQWINHDIHRRHRFPSILSFVRLHLLPKMFLLKQLEQNELISSNVGCVSILHNVLKVSTKFILWQQTYTVLT